MRTRPRAKEMLTITSKKTLWSTKCGRSGEPDHEAEVEYSILEDSRTIDGVRVIKLKETDITENIKELDKMEYTKGEWRVSEIGGSVRYIVDDKDHIIATVWSASTEKLLSDYKLPSIANAHIMASAPKLYEACKRIMLLDDSGPLEAVAYSGGDIPKKWLREVAPAIEAKSKAIKEVKSIIRPAIAKAEGK
jgi:hypothetical protein